MYLQSTVEHGSHPEVVLLVLSRLQLLTPRIHHSVVMLGVDNPSSADAVPTLLLMALAFVLTSLILLHRTQMLTDDGLTNDGAVYPWRQ